MSIVLASEAAQVLHAVAVELGDEFLCRKFVCITTAGTLYQETPWITAEQNALKALGATVEAICLSRLLPSEAQQVIQDSEGIYVHGGNTFFLLQEMQRVGFKEIISPHLGRGRPYIGSSAGSLVAGPRIDIIESTDEPAKGPKVDATKGLGLIDIVPFVHFDVPSYSAAFRTSFEQALVKGVNVLPLRNDQFLIVRGRDFRLVTAH
jgi:dipeptidase E